MILALLAGFLPELQAQTSAVEAGLIAINVLCADQDLNLFDCFGKHKRKYFHFETALCLAMKNMEYLVWFGKPGPYNIEHSNEITGNHAQSKM